MPRLYGLSEAEHLYDDIASVWELEIEPMIMGPGKALIEEWTVYDPGHHLPVADDIIASVWEWAVTWGEVAEDWGEDFPLKDEDVRAVADDLLRVIADRIKYRMANEVVATHTIEWTGDEGENPLLDGEPMYRPSQPDQPEEDRS